MMAGFWKAPRELASMLARRELTATAYTLLHFVAESGADRAEGFVTTNAYLAEALEVSAKMIRRALLLLRTQRLVTFPEHERVALFTISTATVCGHCWGLWSAHRCPHRCPQTLRTPPSRS